MTSIEITTWPEYNTIRFTKADGGTCAHSLNSEQTYDLYKQAQEAHLISLGLEELKIHAGMVEPGDVIESLGLPVLRVIPVNGKYASSRPEVVFVFGDSNFGLRMWVDLQIKVNRRIA